MRASPAGIVLPATVATMDTVPLDAVHMEGVPMETVRWGIIGVGNVTEIKSGPALQQADRSALVAVMRRSGDKAADYARRHGVPRWYDDPDALIADPEVDAVYIATPPDSHSDYALRVAAAGKPVYVEKPMARTAAECEAMIDACAGAGVPLFVAYYRRAMPRFRTVQELLDGGAIGAPRTVSVRFQRRSEDVAPADLPWRLRPEISGGGLFVDMGSHTLDLLDWLLGPVTQVSGMAANLGGHYQAEDLVAGAFQFTSGVRGVGLWLFDGDEDRDEVEITGTTGTLRFSTFGQEPMRLSGIHGDRLIEAPYPAPVQQPLIQTVVDELTGRGVCPSTGVSAARTARVVDTLLRGYRDQTQIGWADLASG
jgi:predicted dehydrogenase